MSPFTVQATPRNPSYPTVILYLLEFQPNILYLVGMQYFLEIIQKFCLFLKTHASLFLLVMAYTSHSRLCFWSIKLPHMKHWATVIISFLVKHLLLQRCPLCPALSYVQGGSDFGEGWIMCSVTGVSGSVCLPATEKLYILSNCSNIGFAFK